MNSYGLMQALWIYKVYLERSLLCQTECAYLYQSLEEFIGNIWVK